MSYVLGIDLGTTYTSAAVVAAGRAEVVQLGLRSSVIPTVVFLTDDQELLVGEAANRRAVSEPARVAREFKRRLGDPAPLLLGGTPMAPQALMGTVLRWVLDQVTREWGEPPAHVAVSHPANWGPYKLDLLEQAVRLADLESATMISEPEAAARYYASTRRLTAGEFIAVYDLGGGTFDAAVLQATESGFEILGTPEGIEHLGGIDIDEAVFGLVTRQLAGALEQLDVEDPVATASAARLRRDCVEAKEALSTDSEALVPVLLPSLQTQVRIYRGELEAVVQPSLVPTIGALERALRSAQVAPDQLSAVLLVGGASRMPLVAQLVGNALGRPVAVDAHPKHAVSLGTALAAEVATAAEPGRAHPVAEIIAPPPTPLGDIGSEPPATPAPEPRPGTARQTISTGAPDTPPPLGPPIPPPLPGGSGDGNGGDATGGGTGRDEGGRDWRRLLYIGAPLAALLVVAIVVLATRGGGGGGDGTGSGGIAVSVAPDSTAPASTEMATEPGTSGPQVTSTASSLVSTEPPPTEPPPATEAAPVSTEPALVTTEPVETTEPVVDTTEVAATEPPVETTEPVVDTTEVAATEPPVETTEPVVATAEVAVATTEPVVATTEPVVETTELSEATTEPPTTTTTTSTTTTTVPPTTTTSTTTSSTTTTTSTTVPPTTTTTTTSTTTTVPPTTTSTTTSSTTTTTSTTVPPTTTSTTVPPTTTSTTSTTSTTTTTTTTTATTLPPVAGTDIAGLAVGQRLPVGAFPDGVTVDAAGRLWVASTFGYSVSRIDPVTGRQDVVAFPEDSDPLAIVALPEGIFVTLRNSDVVARIDPETFAHQTVVVTDSPTFLAWGADSLWSVGSTGIDRIDPATLEVTATVAIEGPAGVAVAGDAAWATQRSAGTLARIDLATNAVVATYPVGSGPDAMATDGDALWIANREEGTVVRFDVATQQITARIPVGTAPSGVAIDGDRVWVTDVDGGSLVLIDRLTATPVSTVLVGGRPLGLQPLDETVWVTLAGENAVAEVRVLDEGAELRPTATIAEITLENGRFVARYAWVNFTPDRAGLHVHFYWNTVPLARAAAPGTGPWLAWAEPDRVEDDFFASTNRPVGATAICVVIVDSAGQFTDVDADGLRDYDTGNCAPLPAQ